MKQYGEETVETVQAWAKEVKDDLLNYQVELVGQLPALIEPVVLKYIEKIKRQMEQSSDESMKAMDDLDLYQVNMAEVEAIMAQMPDDVLPHADPNRKEPTEWTLADIYRILCDNFFRVERLALLAALAPNDIHVTLGDLLALMGGES